MINPLPLLIRYSILSAGLLLLVLGLVSLNEAIQSPYSVKITQINNLSDVAEDHRLNISPYVNPEKQEPLSGWAALDIGRVKLSNHSAQGDDELALSESVFLGLPRGSLRQFYVYRPPLFERERVHYQTKSLSNFNNVYFFSIPLGDSTQLNDTVYLEVVEGQTPLFGHVYNEAQFLKVGGIIETIVIAMRSLMVFTVLFGLFLWVKLNNRVFLAYVSFVSFSFLLYFSYMDGWNYHFLSVNVLSENLPYLYSLFGSASYLSALLFVYLYAQVSEYVPSARRITLTLAAVLVCVIAGLVISQGREEFVAAANLTWLLVGLWVWISAVIALVRGSRYAIYIVVGWTPFIVCALDMLAVAAGWKYGDSFNFAAFDAVVIFELIVFQFGMASMVLSYRQERDSATMLARYDALSGAYNRHGFKEVFSKTVKPIQYRGGSVAVALLDIDFFKQINDQFGHDVGDDCIRAVAQTIQGQLRDSDILVRYGGEEFLVVLPDVSTEKAKDVCHRIRGSIKSIEVPAGDRNVTFTVSIGLADMDMSRPIEDTIKVADGYLYASKRGGRDRLTSA